MDTFSTKHVENRDNKERCQRSQQCSRQSLIQTGVDHFGSQIRILSAYFSNPVKHDDRVVQRVTDDRQERGDHGQIDLEVVQPE